MCVETSPTAKVLNKVTGYKIVEIKRGKLFGLVYHDHRSYQTGKRLKSLNGPGFQAFVYKKDAERVMKDWAIGVSKSFKVVPVLLFNAKRGTVQYMSNVADGKPGLIAPYMTIPNKRK